MKCRVLGLEVYFWRKMGVSRPGGCLGLMGTIRDSVTVGGVLRNSKSLAAPESRTPRCPHHRKLYEFYTKRVVRGGCLGSRERSAPDILKIPTETSLRKAQMLHLPTREVPHDFVHKVLRLLAADSEQLRVRSIRVQRVVNACRIYTQGN